MFFVASRAEVTAISVVLVSSKISPALPGDVWRFAQTYFWELAALMKHWLLRSTMLIFASGFDKRDGALFGRRQLNFITKNQNPWEGTMLA
jgi:hypothetical protein